MKYTMSAVSRDASQIQLVFNRYMEKSIKSQTRQKIYGKGHGPIVHIIADAVIPKNGRVSLGFQLKLEMKIK